MKITETKISGFMMVENAQFDWSPNMNIICGENSSGKTTILKLLYSSVKPFAKNGYLSRTKEEAERMHVDKLLGIFRPDESKIGRLVNRGASYSQADYGVRFDDGGSLECSIGNRQVNRMNFNVSLKTDTFEKEFDAVYIPTKEIISLTSNFASLYEDYELDFEEMYYDLSKLLSRPLSKGGSAEKKNFMKRLEEIIQGTIVRRGNKIFLRAKDLSELEMGLVSDGYRKIATLLYLVQSGSLNRNSILFWDEPETNMNPKMIRPVVQALVELAKMGVQLFVTTHDYFVLQEFNMYTAYPQLNKGRLDFRFYSFFKDENGFQYETQENVSNLEHNAIMEEFDAMYDREQEYIYGTD